MIDSVTIVTSSTTFENGQVDWKLIGDDEKTHDLELNGGLC